MKAKILQFALSASLLTFCACDNFLEEEKKEEQEKPKQTELIGEKRAIERFNQFLSQLNEDVGSRGASVPVVITSVKKTSTAVYDGGESTRSADEGLPVYELTLQHADNSNGYAVVMDATIADEVIAYAPIGAIADTVFNEGLAAYFKDLAYIAEQIKKEKEKVISSRNVDYWQPGWQDVFLYRVPDSSELYRYFTEAELAEYHSITNPMDRERWNNQWRYNGPIDIMDITQAYVPGKWHQRAPYNNKVSVFNFDGTRCKVGCFPIAAGQVMAYHKKSSYRNYNWNQIARPTIYPHETVAAAEVSQLLIDIANISGTNFRQDNGDGINPGGTATTNSIHYVRTFREMGYTSEELYMGANGGSAPIILQEIEEKRPVLYAALHDGEDIGHTWVVDGILRQERWVYNTGGTIIDGVTRAGQMRHRTYGYLMHCNWGWGGSSDGWYYNFSPYNTERNRYYKFSVSKYMFKNIKPI